MQKETGSVLVSNSYLAQFNPICLPSYEIFVSEKKKKKR